MRSVLVALMLLLSAPVYADDGNSDYATNSIPEFMDGAAANVTDDELVIKFETADEACRGNYYSDVAMWEGCALRDAYGALMTGRKICYFGIPTNHSYGPCKDSAD